ncbi:hypothetical protein T310_1465 [Rasamsonia emersonii CBS 393.64]|uniref:Glycosyl transferase n=1 Tax=Rasamsonia emersonii (strain ATCC 16479 / CBS 393.64 / IMI 116815) TaxID=1408163 RepID=A0A0F4Z2W7_RASE3|nr:hypothetical protein T310_1465 [Rasamsonia emersonii CBS 393.64]KKA24436.1 hypothetical protein T310_1465 [Rasamsonia emersonii CBS 393.64]
MPRFLLNRPFLAAAIAICTVLYLSFFSLQRLDWPLNLFDNNSDRQVETFDFQDIADEKRCFDRGAASSSTPIPNVVHAIWLNNPNMTFISYLALRSALISLRPDKLKLHYTASFNEDNVWFQKLRNNLTLVYHDLAAEYPEQLRQQWQVTHLADALRLDVIRQEGGIYMDMDVIVLRSFDNLRHCERDVLLGYEGGDRHGLCNAIIVGRQNASFIRRWIDSYSDFDSKKWNYHSVILPKELAQEHPDEICPLSPTAFFWPTWTEKHIRYMHEPISEAEARDLERTMDANGGGLNTTYSVDLHSSFRQKEGTGQS